MIETNSLIAGQLPLSVGPGAYAGNFNNEQMTEGLPALTDGTFGPSASVSGLGTTNFATCGGALGAGSSVIYAAASGSAWNLTNIVVYSGWGNYDRGGQFYNISYSTVSAPATFIPLASVGYDPMLLSGPNVPSGASANRVNIALANGGMLATNVYAVQFDFTPQTLNLDNGYSGYAEIILQGTNLPSSIVLAPKISAPKISNGNLILTGTGGTPNSGYTWLSATNLTAPIQWTTNSTGTLDGTGAFSNSIPINAGTPANFYRLRLP